MNVFAPILLSLMAGWNVVYCALKVAADFRSHRPFIGAAGLLAMIGILAPLAVAWYVSAYGS